MQVSVEPNANNSPATFDMVLWSYYTGGAVHTCQNIKATPLTIYSLRGFLGC